jgi:triosephosphate isomerase
MAHWVIGNWKMHGNLAENVVRLDAIKAGVCAEDNVVVCVPFPFLPQAKSLLQNSAVSWGAQDVSAHEFGAYTGETSAAMLAEFGSRFVIVGHSERRAYHAESNEAVADKAKAAIAGGLIPIVCVGETLDERNQGKTDAVVAHQLRAVTSVLPEAAQVLVAYEPVWAIGTGRAASLEDIAGVHARLREALGKRTVPILYGGSVNAKNAAEIFAVPNVGGALVGGASLSAEAFLTIVDAARC